MLRKAFVSALLPRFTPMSLPAVLGLGLSASLATQLGIFWPIFLKFCRCSENNLRTITFSWLLGRRQKRARGVRCSAHSVPLCSCHSVGFLTTDWFFPKIEVAVPFNGMASLLPSLPLHSPLFLSLPFPSRPLVAPCPQLPFFLSSIQPPTMWHPLHYEL